MILYEHVYVVDFSEDYEELSLHSTTFEKLQRKVQAADVIGKKKLSSSEGMMDVFFNILTSVFCVGPKEPIPPLAKSDGKLYTRKQATLDSTEAGDIAPRSHRLLRL